MKNSFKVLKTHPQKIWDIEEVKNILRITHNYDDALIENLINTAINACEHFTSLSLRMRDIEITCNSYDKTYGIKLKHLPVLEFLDDGASGVRDNSNIYRIDSDSCKLYLQGDIPQTRFKILYKAGFEQDQIPAEIKQGILAHISRMYDRQEELGGILSPEIRSYYMHYKFYKI